MTNGMWFSVRSTARIDTLIATPLDGSSTSVLHTTAAGTKWSGQVTSGDIVPQVAGLISTRTAIRGRSARGRIYLPYASETAIVDGSLAAGYQAGAATSWETFRAAMNTAGSPLVVASYKGGTAADVTSLIVRSHLATQRRRQPR